MIERKNAKIRKNKKQAGAELGQAQYKIGNLGNLGKLMSSASC